MHDGGGQFLDGGRHGGGKKERLAAGRQLGDDALDLVHEAEVEHAVGLIEDENFHGVVGDAALALQVGEAAGRGDEDIDAAGEGADLRGNIHAAEDGEAGKFQELAVVGEALADLHGELARRREDERAGALGRKRAGVRGEMLEDGQREGGGLAGAGLGDADHVAALEEVRDRLRLDGRGFGVILRGEGALERLAEGEVAEADRLGGRGGGYGGRCNCRCHVYGNAVRRGQNGFAGTGPHAVGR